MKASEILRRAKELIRERGWIPRNGGAESKSGPMCMLNALDKSARVLGCSPGTTASRIADRCLVQATGSEHVFPYNDAPGRTVEEVYAAFDRAIELAEAEEREGRHG